MHTCVIGGPEKAADPRDALAVLPRTTDPRFPLVAAIPKSLLLHVVPLARRTLVLNSLPVLGLFDFVDDFLCHSEIDHDQLFDQIRTRRY